ncbi:MAG: hypothetical protein MK102_09645 [Fuerstiella sp.]|nr:hypothetical protein [Fuerstiella sp.]
MSALKNRQIDWSIPQRCLLLGVAGSGMQALAEILHQAGHTVFGTDITYEVGSGAIATNGMGTVPLVENVHLLAWEDPSPAVTIDSSVCSPAIPESTALRTWTRQRSIPEMSLLEAVNTAFTGRTQICVAGTHGKSTTSSLLAWMLHYNGADPGIFVGAQLKHCRRDGFARQGGHYGSGRMAVIEACEFDCSFLQLQPTHIILNGIDGDHFDSVDAEDAAYLEFLQRVPNDGYAFVNAACLRSMSLSASAGVTTISWAVGDLPCDWSGRITGTGPGHMTVRIQQGRRVFGSLNVPLTGWHNASNLLGAVVSAVHLGMTAAQCQKALNGFPGLKRRLDRRESCRGMSMLDDYAHHPTAVKTTLNTVRQQFPGQRIRVIFEPHQMVRLQRCRDQFTQALLLADEVVVLPVFPARETVSLANCHRSSRDLAATICEAGTPAVFTDGVNSAVSIIEHTGRPEDVFLTMGAGTVHRIHDEVHRRFRRDSAA